jgi:hypothetical protein
LAVVATLACAGFGAQRAKAADVSHYFCPTSSTTSRILINGNSFCVGPGVGDLRRVQAETVNGAGVQHCAVGKQNADGGGSNVVPAQGGTGQVQVTPCVSAVNGYPKITNNTSSQHYFRGRYFRVYCSP